LWCAWTLASAVGVLIGGALTSGAAVTEYFLKPAGLETVGGVLDLVAFVLGATALAALEYLVLRSFMPRASSAMKAWIPVTAAVLVAEYFVPYVLYGLPPEPITSGIQLVPTLIQSTSAVVLGLAQGILLAQMVGNRLAVVLWVVGGMVTFALGEAFIYSGLVDRVFSMLNIVAGLIVGNLAIGTIEGGVSGAFLVLVKRLAREPLLST